MLESVQTYLEVKRGLRASREERESAQRRQFAHLVLRAYAEVPFYRKLYDGASIHPSGVTEPSQVPFVTKQALRRVPEADRLASSFLGAPMDEVVSSGTTGEPLRALVSGDEVRIRHALTTYVHRQAGLRPDEAIFQLTTLPPRPAVGQIEYVQYDADLGRMLQRLVDGRARSVWGFASYLARLAEENARRAEPLRLRHVNSVGEALHPRARERIVSSFGAGVTSLYAAAELGIVGFECAPGRGFHVSSDYLVEIVDAEGRVQPAGQGRLCISALGQHAMPFIRYDIEDLGELDPTPCACGLCAPRIVNFTGRQVPPSTTAPGGTSWPQ